MAETRNQQTLSWMFRLMVGSFVFQALGYVTPGWIYLKFSPSVYSMTGMWYTVLCANECKTLSVSEYKEHGLDRDGKKRIQNLYLFTNLFHSIQCFCERFNFLNVIHVQYTFHYFKTDTT